MFEQFKLTLTGNRVYKEIELTKSMNEVRIGTSMDCNVRLRRELFFCDINFVLTQNNGEWVITCGEGIYLTADGTRKIFNHTLHHGDELWVRYEHQDVDVFRMFFNIDFEYKNQVYDVEIDLRGTSQIKIGGDPQAEIYFPKMGNEYITLEVSNGQAAVTDYNTTYGVWINGTRIKGRQFIKNCDFFSVFDVRFYYKAGKIYTTNHQDMIISKVNYCLIEQQTTAFSYPKFHRNSRVKYQILDEKLEIKSAKNMPKEPKHSILLTLVPALVTLVMTILIRGVIGGGGTFVIYSSVTMSMGIITSVITHFGDKRKYEKECKKRIDDYNEYIKNKCVVIEKARADEARTRDLIYSSIEEDIQAIRTFDRRLFERTEGDSDFMKIYLGRGRIESVNSIKYKVLDFVNPEDPLELIPEEVEKKYRYIENTPIVSDFKNSCGVGIVGSVENLNSFMKNIILDLVARHFFTDVRMVCIFDERFMQNLSWIKWLHNVDNEKTTVRNIAYDEESRNIVIEYLYSVISARYEALNSDSNESNVDMKEKFVVFITNAQTISKHPISQFITECEKYGVTFVFLEEHEEFLPMGCNEIIRLNGNHTGKIINTSNGDVEHGFAYIEIPDAVAEEAAIKLGAIEIDEISLEGELTKNITLFELLGILTVEDLDFSRRWEESKVYKTMAAPLGVKNHGEVVYLDISDKGAAHGPHGLVAGTTGSGKSEILQTYILSMVTKFHPYDVGFVLIDFKGGGMANQFMNLPHLIGTITNIDGREINRSLLSIKAELIKRQEMFSKAGVNHINDYIKLFKEGKVTVPMPHLIIIVDEFAELKAEYPDFMKELVSAARIGRTLGVHLILATQKPAGVVDAQIWSNSKFKLCLKVQTREDSKEVIKSPLAAEIVEPGRAYFQVGNNEIFELFQSAYSGAPVPSGDDNNEREYCIYELNTWGKRTLKYTNKKEKAENKNIPQLDAIVEHVNQYCKDAGIQKLPGICLPPLPDNLNTDGLAYATEEVGIPIPIGILDDPECQKQTELMLNLARDNVYIVGSSQMGKTVMLQSILYGMMRMYTTTQVNAYIVDCGSMVLKLFEKSSYVGGVVLSDEEEKCKNLFKMINRIVIERKKLLSGFGVGNFLNYLEQNGCNLPLVCVIIDNIAAFKEYFPMQFDELSSLVREAQSVGISFIITSMTANGLASRVQSNFGEKIVLNCNDPSEYSTVFGHCRKTPKEVAGRGFASRDKRILEFQTAIFGKDKKEGKRSEELAAYIEERNLQMKEKAPQIPVVPEHLVLHTVMKATPQQFRESGRLPIGMEYDNVTMEELNMNTTGSLTLIGAVESRTAFLVNFLYMIQKTIVFHNINAYVIDDSKAKTMNGFANAGFVEKYTTDSLEAMQIITDFCDQLKKREELADLEDESRLLLVINNKDFINKLSQDKTMGKMIADTMRTAFENKGFILISGVENQAVSLAAGELLKVIKTQRQGIFFGQLTENKIYDNMARIKPDPTYDTTKGYRFDADKVYKIKIFDKED